MTATVSMGLCARCAHRRDVPTRRAVFVMCRLGLDDPAFPRYPRLPVTACAGFAPEGAP